jgi:hypothetical protein
MTRSLVYLVLMAAAATSGYVALRGRSDVQGNGVVTDLLAHLERNRDPARRGNDGAARWVARCPLGRLRSMIRSKSETPSWIANYRSFLISK